DPTDGTERGSMSPSVMRGRCASTSTRAGPTSANPPSLGCGSSSASCRGPASSPPASGDPSLSRHPIVTEGPHCPALHTAPADRPMPVRATAVLLTLVVAGAARAGAIYPIDRASVLAGSRFDLKVEFDGVVAQKDVRVTVGGAPAETVFGKPGLWLEREDGKPATSWGMQGVSLEKAGPVEGVATGGSQTAAGTVGGVLSGARQEEKGELL